MEYGGPEFGHWGGEGDESDATSAQEILQLFAQIGGEDISLDEGVTQHGDTDRTSFLWFSAWLIRSIASSLKLSIATRDLLSWMGADSSRLA